MWFDLQPWQQTRPVFLLRVHPPPLPLEMWDLSMLASIKKIPKLSSEFPPLKDAPARHHGNAAQEGTRRCFCTPERRLIPLLVALTVGSLWLMPEKNVHHILKYSSNHHGNGRSVSLRHTSSLSFSPCAGFRSRASPALLKMHHLAKMRAWRRETGVAVCRLPRGFHGKR